MTGIRISLITPVRKPSTAVVSLVECHHAVVVVMTVNATHFTSFEE